MPSRLAARADSGTASAEKQNKDQAQKAYHSSGEVANMTTKYSLAECNHPRTSVVLTADTDQVLSLSNKLWKDHDIWEWGKIT